MKKIKNFVYNNMGKLSIVGIIFIVCVLGWQTVKQNMVKKDLEQDTSINDSSIIEKEDTSETPTTTIEPTIDTNDELDGSQEQVEKINETFVIETYETDIDGQNTKDIIANYLNSIDHLNNYSGIYFDEETFENLEDPSLREYVGYGMYDNVEVYTVVYASIYNDTIVKIHKILLDSEDVKHPISVTYTDNYEPLNIEYPFEEGS